MHLLGQSPLGGFNAQQHYARHSGHRALDRHIFADNTGANTITDFQISNFYTEGSNEKAGGAARKTILASTSDNEDNDQLAKYGLQRDASKRRSRRDGQGGDQEDSEAEMEHFVTVCSRRGSKVHDFFASVKDSLDCFMAILSAEEDERLANLK